MPRPSHPKSKSGLSILLGCALIAMVSAGPVIATTSSLFIVPISKAFGWSRTEFPLAVMAAAWAAGLASPVAGKAIDRFGARRVMLGGVLTFALSNMLLALANGSRLQVYPLYMLLGAASAFSGVVGVNKIVSAWFQEARGRALGLSVGMGVGLGAAATPLLVQYVIEHGGWRWAYVALGLAVLVSALPAVLFLPSHAPARPDARPHASDDRVGFTPRQAAATREFWLLLGLVIFNGFAVGAMSGHWAPIQTERGLSMGLATALLSTFAIVKIGAQVGGGILLDRFHTPKLAVLILFPAMVAVAAYALGAGVGMAVVAAILFGLGEGAELGLIPYLVSRYFGLRRFGEIFGYLTTAIIISAGLGNVLMGRLFDLTGDYRLGLAGGAVSLALAMAAAAALGPYRFGVPRQPKGAVVEPPIGPVAAPPPAG